MGSRLEWIYQHSPIFFQNFMATAYGRSLNRLRYGGVHEEHFRFLLDSQAWSRERLLDYQLRQLQQVVRNAYEHVPFYRRRMEECGLGPDFVKSLSDIERLPVTEKDDLLRNPEEFLAGNIPPDKRKHGTTSGTTGKILPTVKTAECYQRNWAFQRRAKRWHGIELGMRRATFWYREIVSLDQRRPPYWRYDRTERNRLYSMYHFSEETAPSYVERLVRDRPEEIVGLPSALYPVAHYLLKTGEKRVRPRVVITSAENFGPGWRETIEEAFACRVADQYGSSENHVWISQCEEGTYHLHPEYGLLEVHREGRVVGEGPGEVVATGFVNDAMPLLRYRIGDSLHYESEVDCACGRAYPAVREILGRSEDLFLAPDGRYIGRMNLAFKDVTGILESQVIQEALDRVLVKVVREPNYREEYSESIIRGIQDLMGEGVSVRIEHPDRIPRERSGKLIFQRSLVGRSTPERDAKDGEVAS